MFYFTQGTNKHIVKALDVTSPPAIYGGSFGVFGVAGTDNTHLTFPQGLTADLSGNIYVCSRYRIVKLTSSLTYVSEASTMTSCGDPFGIIYDVTNNALYVAGIWENAHIRLIKMTTALAVTVQSGNFSPNYLVGKPSGICRGFTADSFIICGINRDLYKTVETGSFTPFNTVTITGEPTTYPRLFTTTTYNSMAMHSNGYLYLNNGRKILKVDNTYTNIGDSEQLARTLVGLKECADGSLVTYNADTKTLIRLNENMNYIEDIFTDTGSLVSNDNKEDIDFVEL
ncbi:MAG: hypothetical protein Q7R33_05045 [Nitrosarchaeum sp.]|nr:hypothetical protein [Nitrosarchaeum sp.]